jgi:CheY-like chemotaxis protein
VQSSAGNLAIATTVTSLGGLVGLTTVLALGTKARTMSETLPPDGPAPRGSKAVLVVEDDEVIRAALASGLSFAGYEASQAADGRAALRHLEAQQPALILLDLRLPDMDGSALIADLRRRGLGAGIPIILISADADLELTAASLGASAYFRKPLRFPALLQAVARLVG